MGSKALIEVKKQDDEKWVVVKFEDHHNHDQVSPLSGLNLNIGSIRCIVRSTTKNQKYVNLMVALSSNLNVGSPLDAC